MFTRITRSSGAPTEKVSETAPETSPKTTLAYRALLIFSLLYFARPEDFIPGLEYIPIEKILGGVALVALLFSIKSQRRVKRWPTELKLLLALFFWQCLTVPFAWWKGGAFVWVYSKCSKAVIAAFLVIVAVSTIRQLKLLLFVQAASVASMTLVSVALYRGGRMGGVLGGVFDNPNDLAMNIALNWPLCLMFLMLTRNPLKKALWAAGMLVMAIGLMLTYSRSGFVAMTVAALFGLWEFGIRGRRHYLLALGVFCAVALVILAPRNYGGRLRSIVSDDVAVFGDAKFAREDLLKESLVVSLHHPLFGIGPGNFASYTESWHVTHNTYTELSAESGIPSLLLFLAVIAMAFRNIRRTRASEAFKNSEEIRLYTGGLWAGLASYLTGAMFASTAYELFPYFMIAYTVVLYRLTWVSPTTGLEPEIESKLTRLRYSRLIEAQRSPAWAQKVRPNSK
jgi:putative inorganic carbon (hco3(-)) transporter